MNTKHSRSKSSACQNNERTAPGTPPKFLAKDNFVTSRQEEEEDDDNNHDDMYDYYCSGKENTIFRCSAKELPTSDTFRLEISPAWTEDSDDKENSKTRKEKDFDGFYCSLVPRTTMASPDTCIYWEEKLDSSSDSVSKICS